jgi:lipoyl(octanoyl) transferase
VDAVAALPLRVRDLGRQPYLPVWRAMQAFTDARDDHTADELWLVEHDPVYTLGGQVTYHGPGQLVAYPLLDLRRCRLGVRELVHRIEQAIIDVLAGYGIDALRRDGAPGVYVGEAKIAALGLRVRRGCSFHGLAFNIAMDLAPFAGINPCGYQGLAVTQVLDFLPSITPAQVAPRLVDALSHQLGLRPEPAPAPDLASPA